MVTSTHFHNFAPADAVQYDGEHGDEALFDAGHESTIALYMRHATAVLDLLKRGA